MSIYIAEYGDKYDLTLLAGSSAAQGYDTTAGGGVRSVSCPVTMGQAPGEPAEAPGSKALARHGLCRGLGLFLRRSRAGL
ncbi:hypothetical protein FNH09_24270 [Streptomyces adustus]|uniref:Uncharacterized protein n=1 Tax=Streptomyces adustus TaxID=1609272 RepID=A0A5N8VHR6_9ACTN|nr:hypothetical protein [Streptomyces adustus]MPY34242.1 hypothetical protein [Streptomyces adustus]